MENMEKVFCIYFKNTEEVEYNSFTKNDIEADDTIVIYNNEIDELVNTEMDEGCHDDYLEEYDNALEFYLSNVESDNYLEYVQSQLDDRGINDNLAIIIQDEVIDRIKEKVNDSEITIIYDKEGENFIGVWEGDHIPVSEIPESDYHKFWGGYEYTHAGELWKKACEKISDMKKEGHHFQDGEKIKIE